MTQNKKRKRIRLTNYNYSESGYYFVTICSNNRKPIFGEYNDPVGAGLASARDNDDPKDNNFELSPTGKIIQQQWRNIPDYYEHVELDEYIIMPNHLHGIIIINCKNKRSDGPVETRADARPAPTLSDIICAFKSRSTLDVLRYIKQNNLKISGNIWQRSFYDHVIRNEQSLNSIRDYIASNPVNWELDIENRTNL